MRDGHLSRKKEEKLEPTAGQCSPQPATVPQVPALWEGFNTFSVANELVSGEKIRKDIGSGPWAGGIGVAE